MKNKNILILNNLLFSYEIFHYKSIIFLINFVRITNVNIKILIIFILYLLKLICIKFNKYWFNYFNYILKHI